MKKIICISVCFLLILFFTTMFVNCKNESKVAEATHYIDTTLQRMAQIEKCASCHKDVYDNWKIGPHANSFLKLEEHDKLIDTSRSFPNGYNTYVEDVMKDVCISCHTGQNIYEMNFKGVSHGCILNSINKDSFPDAFKQAFSRNMKERDHLISGVDCITCHAQNGKVVTKAESQASAENGVIKSALFGSNANCYSCHHHQVSTMQELVQSKKLDKELSCVNCHQEYKNKGEGTHYFYWRNDHNTKKRPEHLYIFECVRLHIFNSGKTSVLQIDWTNTLMPHGFSECGEARCLINVVMKNGEESVLFDQLLNRKNFFDKIDKMPRHFKMGTNGNEFIYKVPLVREVVLPNPSTIDHFEIIGQVKPQYWSDAKEFIEIYKKVVRFN